MHTSGTGFIVEAADDVRPVGTDSRVANARMGAYGAYGQIGKNADGSPKFGRENVYFRVSAWNEMADRLGSLQPGDQFEFSGRVRSAKSYEKDGVTHYPDNTLELSTIDFTPGRNRSHKQGVEASAESPAAEADAPVGGAELAPSPGDDSVEIGF